MGLFDRSDRCPPHDWTKWEVRTEDWVHVVGWRKNKQLLPYDQKIQSRQCTKCGYTEQEEIN